jgi:pyruvate,water dikinase
MRRILWLNEIQLQSYQAVGNKAASLARLLNAGYTIPPGFVLTWDLLLDCPRHEWESDLNLALKTLPPPWIVRSSSSAEDSVGMAFAGLFTTVLGLTSETAAADAVQKVMASLDSDLVRAYARHHGIQVEAFRMAVLVQRMLNPTASGVAFSRHPNGRTDSVAIEATYGLGAPLVDGTITPDLVVVDREERVSFERIGSKRVRANFAEDRVHYEEVSEEERRHPVLTTRQARSIAEMARRAEKIMGAPQDIEWVVAEQTLNLLQSRRITTMERHIL